MSDAIKTLHNYLAKSPSVVYPEDVLAYLPAIEAENAKLRERAVNLLNAVVAKSNELFDLLCENEKLRELARDLYECGDSCTHCRHWNQGDGFYCDLGVGWKARRMRELGMEIK